MERSVFYLRHLLINVVSHNNSIFNLMYIAYVEQSNSMIYLFFSGAFSLGIPEHATCPIVLQPENGRFVCSVGTILERSMCLVECKIGFEQEKPPVVYICEKGSWLNLQQNVIDTPEPHCIPKSVADREFAE